MIINILRICDKKWKKYNQRINKLIFSRDICENKNCKKP